MDPQQGFTEFCSATKDSCLRALVAGGAERAAAEEALAEAFARAWARWPVVSRHPAPTAWVMRVALNHQISRWRRHRREVTLGGSGADTAAHDAGYRSDRDDLLRAVASLPERQRQVVALRILLDLDTQQTGDVLGIAAGTVTAHLHRALTTLRTRVTETTESH